MQIAPDPAKRPRIDPPNHLDQAIDLARGAEALITKIPFMGRQVIRKQRFPKRYRHPDLDSKLTARRIQQEARVVLRLRKAGLRVPAVYEVDISRGIIIFQYVDGVTLKHFLGKRTDGEQVMRGVGIAVANMHKANVIHGDLTTSNIMVSNVDGENQVWIIDFGLSSVGSSDEDIAVDLYVFERAVISAHSEEAEPLNKAFLEAYNITLNRESVSKRLVNVRARGRKRDMTG